MSLKDSPPQYCGFLRLITILCIGYNSTINTKTGKKNDQRYCC